MSFSSSLSLCSHINIFSSKATDNNLLRNAQIAKSPKTPQIKLLASSKSPKINTHLSKTPTKDKGLHRILVEKAAGFVIGSVIFVGCFSARPAVAIPNQTNQAGVNSEVVDEDRDKEFLYERLLESEPNNVEALKVVLHAKMRRGENKEAVKVVEKLVGLEPREVEWRLLRALCYEMMGDLSTAKRLFKEILKEKPLLLRALHGLALVMHKNHEGPAVFVMLDKALQLARREKRVTEERNIRILIAQMHVVKGDLEESLKEFQNLVDEDYRDFRPYLCLGIVYSLLDKKTEAAEQFEMYRALVPEEFPQRGFLDDVMLTAKSQSREQLQEEFRNEYSSQK